MNQKLRLILISTFFLSTHLFGQNIYLSPNGKDSHKGTAEQPIRSFEKAWQLLANYPKDRNIKVILKEGTYYLSRPIQFTLKQGRTAGATLTLRSEQEGKAIISGGKQIHLRWKKSKRPNIFYAKVPKGIEKIDLLYINDTRQRMARYPNATQQEGYNVYDCWKLRHKTSSNQLDALSPEKVNQWKHPEGGFIHAMHHALWGDMHWLITGKDEQGKLTKVGGWQNNRPSSMHPTYRFVENIFEELDAPGEWYFDQQKHRIYYYPTAENKELKRAKVEVVMLENLIQITGEKGNKINGIKLEGITFKHTARTFMKNKEPLLRSDWTIYRNGGVYLENAAHCEITHCEFNQLGGNTIFVNNDNEDIRISSCYIHQSGANGIAFVGNPNSVRNPLFRYGKQDYTKLSFTPGPQTEEYPKNCVVHNCLITQTGRDEKQTAPIQISMAYGIKVDHCSIYDVPRAGINISEGTFGGHLIEHCDIFNTVLETGDHGSFNSWGRDRFWTPDIKETTRQLAAHPGLAYLDMISPNIIRYNRFRCDHGWDIDLDDGSSYYRIYNNVLLNGGLKLREGYDRIVTNNIILNNSFHPHVWYDKSQDVFAHNLVFANYFPIGMDIAIAKGNKWGKEIDNNIFAIDTAIQQNGGVCDLHSIVAQPQFTDAAHGNYTVNNKAILDLGFQNFDTQHFGVVSAKLKAITKQPILPVLKSKTNQQQEYFNWLDAQLINVSGNALSAYGVGFEKRGVAFAQVKKESLAARKGLKSGDLILSLNNKRIESIIQLKDFLSKNRKLIEIRLVREQKEMTLTLKL